MKRYNGHVLCMYMYMCIYTICGGRIYMYKSYNIRNVLYSRYIAGLGSTYIIAGHVDIFC